MLKVASQVGKTRKNLPLVGQPLLKLIQEAPALAGYVCSDLNLSTLCHGQPGLEPSVTDYLWWINSVEPSRSTKNITSEIRQQQVEIYAQQVLQWAQQVVGQSGWSPGIHSTQ